jgi:predicted ATP-grasp superfamily ATP-dependent carboligase
MSYLYKNTDTVKSINIKRRNLTYVAKIGLMYLVLEKFLIIGIDIVALASSAKRAGYGVYSVDHFGDIDLRNVSDDCFSIIEQKRGNSCGRFKMDFDEKFLLKGAQKLSRKHRIDSILFSTGLEDSPEILYELSKIAPILGNTCESIEKVRDKEKLFLELKKLGVASPETIVVDNISTAVLSSKDIGYPILIKPVKSFGGSDIKKIANSKELVKILKNFFLFHRRIIIQKYIPGTAASISLISCCKGSVILTVNKQLIGLSVLGQKEPFGYCGNIVPLNLQSKLLSKCKEFTEIISKHFKLIGSNGIDFVISPKGIPYVVEINPRFQGTLECVEKVLGINMVRSHIEACLKGILPKVPRSRSYCVRLILSCPDRSIVPDLSRFSEVRDIPFPGVIVEKGEPLCSVLTEGNFLDKSFKNGKDISEAILHSLKPIVNQS